MANIWDDQEREFFSERRKKGASPASSNLLDAELEEYLRPKPQAGLTSSQISSSVDRYQASLYGVGEAVAEGVGAKDSAEWLKAQREENEFLADKASKRARDLGAVDRWDDVHGVGDFGSYAKGLAIQSLPYAAEALAGGVLARGAMSGTRAALAGAKTLEEAAAAKKALNIGSQAGAVAASYPSAVGDVLGNQREQSDGETRGGVAAALAVPYAALNAIGIESALARGTAFKNTVNILDRGTGAAGAAARTAATATGVALKEGASETGQEMLNQVGRMSVDANEAFLSAAAQERFKESFIGGAALGGMAGGLGGGWRRSEGGNELSQAMGDKAVNQPDITTTQFVPPVAPPAAPAEITPTTTDAVSSEQQVPPAAPAVSGGTTDIAAAQQQAQADQQAQQVADQQAQQAQSLQERRDTVAAYFGAEPTLDNGQHVGGMIMGKAFTDPAKYNAELDKLAANEESKSDLRRQVEAAYMQTLPAEKRKLAAVQGGALKFWTNKPDLAAVAEGINTAMTELVAAGKGTNDAKLTQMAQMYEALTGQEAPAYAAAQQVQPKGVKNDKLQLQNDAGLREVSVSGGTTEASTSGDGGVRPAQVQPVGATSVGAGPSDIQAGQPSTGGVRTSAGDVSNVVGGEATPQVSEAPDGQTQTAAGLGDGGQVSGQTGQVADVSVPPTTGGTTEAVPAASVEKIEQDGDILSNLYRQVLTPTQEKRGGATLDQRIEMVRLALIEQASEAEIAALTGLSLTTVDAQLRRLGVVMRPQYSQANLDTRAAIAERLGIPAEALAGVEDVTVEGVARPSKEQKQAAQAKYLSDSITADVTPEDRARSVSRLVATYDAASEQYECVTPKPEVQRNGKIKQYERLDVLFQRAADAYTSPEFPQGIPRRDLLELVTPRRVITLKDSISDQQRAEFEGESQDFDNTKYLSEELYGGEEQEGKSMGTVASAGGSQGAVETQRKADLGKIEKLQTQMGKLAADDVEGRAAIQKQLNIEYAKYHVRTLEAALANLPKPSEMTDQDAALKVKLFTQLDAARAEFAAASAGESTTTAAAPKNEVSDEVKAVKAKFKETKGDLTKFDMGELQLLLDEANKFKNMALAKKLDAEMAGRTTTTEPANAVQEPSPAQVPVQERAGSSETVGQGDTEGGQAAAESEAKAEPKQEEVIKTPAEQWSDLAAQFPAMPSYESLSKDAKIRWDDVANRGVANLAAADKILNTAVKEQPVEAPSTVGTTEAVTESNVGMATELTPEQTVLVEGPVSELTEGQTIRLEKHYDAKRGTSEFLTKLHGDIALYAAKGAAAVHAAIRDIVKALYTAVLAVAVVFNPTYMNKVEAFTVSPAQEYSVTQEVKAEAPAEAAAKMSTAAKQAYATLMPALKADLTAKNKLLVMADKPSGRIFVFTPDGKLVLEKKSLFGLAKGDFYKGNNDLPTNRVTPAGLHNLVMVDAAKGGAAAKTAGEYDFGKVFGIVDENPGVLTIMHSVWLHENDAAKRTAALKNENAADSRYSFGCINVDKATYKNLIDNYGQQMDGAKLFVVPDNQERVMDFVTGAVAQNKTGEDKLVRQSVQPVTTTTTGNRQGVTQASTERNIVGKEENGKLSSKSKPFAQFLEFDELDTYLGGMDLVRDQLADAGIPDAINLVSDWELIDDSSDTADHGSLRTVQGRYVGTLNVAKLDNAGYAAETARHEIAHAIDMGPHGGIYSAQPEMGVSVVDGVIRAEGPVAKELYALYENNADWNNFLAYPFNSDEHPDLNNRTKVQLELFAQAFSVYTTPQGRARMEADAPITAAYFKEVIQDVKSTKPLQIQKAEIAALRTAVLYTRRESKGNRGPSKVLGLDERIDELLASRSRQFKEGLENTLPASVTKPAKSVVTNLATAAKNGLLAAGITEDIVNMAGKYMRSAQDYLTAQYARQKTRLDFEQRIEHILDAFDKLPKHLQGEGAGSVNRFILDSTMSKKWGFYPGEHRIGTTLFEVDPELSRRFFAIEQESPAAAQVIRDVFEHGYQALKAKKEAIDTAVEREFAERTKAATGDADMMAEVAQAKKLMRTQLGKIQNVDFTTPYAYLGRYGDYVVAAKSAEFKYWEGVAAEKGENKERATAWLADNVSNPDHYVVQFAETQGEADQIAADLMATGKFDMDGTEAGPKEDIGSFVGSDVHLAVARLRSLITRQGGDEGEGSVELNRMISDLYLMTAAENSARKSEIMRKYVAGANGNMMRNLATSGRADAHFLSTMKHNDEVTDALERMRTEAKSNVREAMPIYNELFKRQTNSLEYKTPSTLSQALTQATTLWFLSTSPAFYLQQLLQTTVLSLPYMSGRLGYFRSVRAIKSAYSDVATLVKGLGANAHIDFSKAPEDVRAMLQTLVGMGKIDIGIDADAKARAGEHGALDRVMRKLQGVNNRIEAINRSTAAIAAYRGYIQRYGAGDTAAATKFAADVVSNTHGSYDGFNTPRILSSDTGRLVGQFKRFQIIQLSMLGKLIHGAFKGANSDERLVARRALAFITGHMAVVGGALGVPFVQQVASLLLAAFGDDDEPKDLEYKLRQAIGDETTANLLLNGVPSAMGVNLGGKLGMGNVASLLPFTDVDLSTRSGYEKVVVGLMGPFFGGLAPKFADGAGMMAKGEYYKGLELLMPNGIGNAMKGARFASEGVTMRNGDVVLKPEEISMVDAAFQAVGLPTNTITSRQYTQKVTMEFDKFYTDRAASIKGAYVNANRDGDTEGMAEARKDWEELQASRKRNGYTIQPMSELFKATVAARKRESSVVGGVETTKANKQFVKNII